MERRVGTLAVLAVVALLSTPGCSARRGEEAGLEEGAVEGQAAVDEQALREGRAGSLAQARAGTLGREGLPSGPLADAYFSYDSFDLDDEARRVLQKNADWLNERPNVRLEIEGHCDDRGTIEYNLALGAKRASAAKTYLVSLGVEVGRITTISYGEELPLCNEASESCWAKNRRAHFVVVGE